jgi:hypothetical protein
MFLRREYAMVRLQRAVVLGSSVVQEFGAGVRERNPAIFLDNSSVSRLQRRYKEISVKNI